MNVSCDARWPDDLTVLCCHDKTTELLCHTDIIDALPYIVLYSGDATLPIDHIEFRPTQRHNVAGIGLMTALQHCRDHNVKTFRYVNADDWLFRLDLVRHWFGKLKTYDLCGYSWLGRGLHDLTVNEVYCRVDAFHHLDTDQCIDELESKKVGYVEKHIGAIMMPGVKHYRLPGREIPAGIGHLQHDRRNSRWWHREWQAIFSHDDGQRFDYYLQLRPFLDHEDLEQRQYFKAWLNGHWQRDIEGKAKYVT